MSKFEISETIVTAYLETLLWTSNLSTEDGEPVEIDGDMYDDQTPCNDLPGCDVSDLDTLSPATVTQAREDLEGFQAYCLESLGIDPFKFFDPSQVAHDFALSRNGHGAGFFDDRYTINSAGPQAFKLETDLADELQSAAKTFGTHGIQVWVENGTLKLDSHS
jgi:hypothetical protein